MKRNLFVKTVLPGLCLLAIQSLQAQTITATYWPEEYESGAMEGQLKDLRLYNAEALGLSISSMKIDGVSVSPNATFKPTSKKWYTVVYQLNSTELPDYAFNVKTIGNFTTEGITAIGEGALPGEANNIVLGEGLLTIGARAFGHAPSSLTLPSTLQSIGADAFYVTNGTTESVGKLYIPNVASWLKVELGNQYSSPFCYSLSSEELYVGGTRTGDIYIPAGTTTIGNYTFFGFDHAMSFHFPASVTTISESAFDFKADGSTIPFYTTSNAAAVIAYADAHPKIRLSVSDPVSIAFTEARVSIYRQQAYTLKTNLPAGIPATDVTWSSSASTTVHVDEYGVVSGLAGGTATITATYGESSATCTVTVSSSYQDGESSHYYVDGIWYTLNKTAKTAEVTFRGSSVNSYSNEYTGAVVIPASIRYQGEEYSVSSIGDNAFYNCSRLTSIVIGNSVTSIGFMAFYNCSGLTSVTIPESVNYIKFRAFYD